MKIPSFRELNIPEVANALSHLAYKGKLGKTDDGLTYLKVDDEFINRLYPLLPNKQIKKPEEEIGAHVSVIYPEENKQIDMDEFNQEHQFKIKNIVEVAIDSTTYYVVLVESSSLLELRRKHSLPDLLSFRGYSVIFHITIGVA